MKIALIGYGKMGKTIESIAKERGHEIVAIIAQNKTEGFLNYADVAIEFSTPNAAVENYLSCFNTGVPVVSGTTGWLGDYDKVVDVCKQKNQGFFYASNFSIGVNIFFELNRKLADMMSVMVDYHASMEEIHHVEKLDAPSGTAISLAEDIVKRHSFIKDWELGSSSREKLPITAKRIDKTPGTHTIVYDSPVDSIEIKHTAKSRQGFALGAVLAAEFIKGKKGVYSMQDLLHL